jgi:PKD repeat protein
MIKVVCNSLLSRSHRNLFAVLISIWSLFVPCNTAHAAQATLTWDASPQAEVVGYMLHYGQVSGTYTNNADIGNVNSFMVTGLQEGKTYFYAVTAYDAGRAESPFSNEASAATNYTAPVAAFDANTTNGVAPATLLFTSSSTGTISSYSWSFGDGTSSTAQNPNHTYSAAGTYSVSLTATGPGGSNTSTRTGYVVVTAPTVTPPPTANFSATGTSGVAPLAVAFTSTTTGSVSSYNWNFGDGTSSTSQNPTHSYATPGTYTVSLAATGPGGTNTMTKTGYISVSATVPAAPVASFTSTTTSGAAPLTVTFTSTSTGNITGYSWNFGDGTTSTAANPSHAYSNAGQYSVSLSVAGAGGSNTMTKTNFVTVSTTQTPPPPANEIIVDNLGVGVQDANRTFTGKWCSSGGTAYYGTASLYSCGSSKDTYRWSFSTPTTGSYNVYVRWSTATNRTASVPITVSGDTGLVTKNFNQKANGGQWILHGSYKFTAGVKKYVEISDSNGLACADAIRIVPAQAGVTNTALVAAYNFDEGTGSSVADRSGKSNNGVVANTTWATTGHAGKALTFNGVSSWVTVSDSASLDLSAGMTLEAWVYPTVVQSGWTNIIMKEQAGASVYYLAANSDLNVPVGGVFSGGAERKVQGKSTLPVNVWTHLATTYDGATQKFYMNGVLVSSRAQTGAIQASTGALRIGGDSIWGEYFKGMIDDVRIYNRAMSNSEIQADMLSPVSN